MTRHPFSTSPSYLQILRGFHKLHSLTLAGQDDTPEADAIRDGMDHPWYDLSETEQKRMKGLSEDLYSISDPPQESLPANPQAERKLIEADEARRAGDWDQALELLRHWGRYTEPALLSFNRGLVWQAAGDDGTAIMFFEHAARLDPKHFENCYLVNLWNSNVTAGQKLAREIIAAEMPNSAEIVFIASSIQFMDTKRNLYPECQTELTRIISALERSISRAKSDDLAFPSLKNETIKNLLFLLACCHERLANSRMAIHYLDQALEINPNDSGILVARGGFRYGVDSGAVDDLKRANDLGSQVVWPSFYLAHHSLVVGQFEECLKMCERSLIFPEPDEVRAMLYEWLAISRSELKYPPDQVRSAFEEAIRLAPDADRIRENFEAFEAALANPIGPRPEWIKPRAATVQAFGRSDFRPPWPPLPFAA